ncbi:unnamed protein product, partial [Scytosiphon promiscuus]
MWVAQVQILEAAAPTLRVEGYHTTTVERLCTSMLGQQQHRANSRTNGVEVQRSNFDGNGQGRAFDRWSAHVRYFLARYPMETRDLVAQRLAAYGIRSLLSSHRQEDLTLDALFAATDAADKEVLSLMRQHARGRQE